MTAITWTGRSDCVACCENSRGPVRDAEVIARLLHSKNLPPEFEPFRRAELFAGKSFSNKCGDADGCSVIRCETYSPEQIQEKAEAQATLRSDREAKGALLAEVRELRNIAFSDLGGEQIVYVYDDPTEYEEEHAVMRCNEKIPRANQDFVRVQVSKIFSS